MCEHDDLDEFARRAADVTRRQFGAMALGAGVLAALPELASAATTLATAAPTNTTVATSPATAAETSGAATTKPSIAVATSGIDVDIKTPDGMADAYFVHPVQGRHPGVLIWPDIFGLRPAFKDMATRLAGAGFSVLVINPFYRVRKAPTAPPHPDFNDPATRDALMALAGSLSPATAAIDAKSFVAFLDAQPSVDVQRKLGTTGYCMGGPFVLRTAAAFPDRIGAGATFHGGGLVTDKPDSPHLLIPQMKGHFLIAIADNDDKRDPAAKDVLHDAFAQAHLPAEIEVYTGAQHGWCPPDSQVYNPAQAEKAWSRLLALLNTSLA